MAVRLLLPMMVCGFLSAQTPDASELLSRIRSAVGYDVLAASPLGFRASGTVLTSGVKCDYQFTFGPRKVLTQVTGRLGRATAMDGAHFWMTEMSGESHPAGPMDSDDIRFDAAILAHAYLDPGAGFLVQRAPEADTPKTFALGLVYPGSPVKARLLVDRESALPSGFSMVAGYRSTTYGIQSYIGSKGLRIPGRFTVTCDDMTDTVQLASLEPAKGGDYSMPESALRATFDPAVGPDLEVARDNGMLLVHPLVNGQDVGWFVFDTGAGMNVLTPAAAKKLGVEPFGDIAVEGLGGRATSRFVVIDQIQVGPATLPASLMVDMDLSFLHSWHKIAGILGYGLIANLVVQLDSATPALSVYPALNSRDLDWHPLVIDRATPHVEAKVEGHGGMCLLDSGYTRTMLIYPGSAKAFNLLEGRKTTSTKTTGVGGSIPSRQGTVSTLEWGGQTLRDTPVVFASESKATSSNPYLLGSIGNRILSSFVVVLDYRGQRIALTPHTP